MSKVWIYQANRMLTDSEVEQIQIKLNEFVQSWTTHGASLAATAKVAYNLFIILEVDESAVVASGCSIDKSVHFLKTLETTYGVDFFDRLKVSFIDESGTIKLVERQVFEQYVRDGKVGADTIVFNNLVQNTDDLAAAWKIPFKNSWHSKVF